MGEERIDDEIGLIEIKDMNYADKNGQNLLEGNNSGGGGGVDMMQTAGVDFQNNGPISPKNGLSKRTENAQPV